MGKVAAIAPIISAVKPIVSAVGAISSIAGAFSKPSAPALPAPPPAVAAPKVPEVPEVQEAPKTVEATTEQATGKLQAEQAKIRAIRRRKEQSGEASRRSLLGGQSLASTGKGPSLLGE